MDNDRSDVTALRSKMAQTSIRGPVQLPDVEAFTTAVPDHFCRPTR